MGRASSASLTCSAPRSASEYTATVRTPSRRAVRITRQAISPRLAIRILPNTLAFALSPARLALLEERRDALLAFRRDADLGDAPGGIRDQRVVQRPPGESPSFASEQQNFASGVPSAKSQAATSPVPPANAGPCTRAMVGFDMASSDASISASARASPTFS